ncbi:MAG TPA: hypothetical protein VH560_01315, partial [Polyangia bacterium]|nr:hypothetical protein [Polyangia bacterium]
MTFAAILLGASTANAAPDPFVNPVTADVIDVAATAQWVDGRETPVANFLSAQLKERRPNEVTWFLDSRGVHGGHSGVTFGTSMQPGAR